VKASIPAPCKIQLVELSGELQHLTLDRARYRAVGLFFLAYGIPLGHKYLHAAELPLTPDQVWTVAVEAILPALTDYIVRQDASRETHDPLPWLTAPHPFEEFRRLLRSRPESVRSSNISVVVCTRERPDSLRRCLYALESCGDDSVEYIVVDNAPESDATRRLVATYPNFRYCLEPRPGLSHARNTGIRCSRGDLVAFTDDDVVVTENWLTELARPFADPKVMCSTGLVIPAEMESREQSWFEHWLSFHRGYLPIRFGRQWFEQFRTAAPVWRIGAGASMAIRRSAFEKVGLFDTRLGAGASGCSEDSEFWYRVLAAGYDCMYVPAALALHYHRADAPGLIHQMRMYARGHAAALIVQFARHRDLRILRRLCLTLPLFYLRKLAVTAALPEWRPFWTATLQGHLAGTFYLLGCGKDQSGALAGEPVESPRPNRMLGAKVASQAKADRAMFLSRNPFPRPFTIGLYYREKMRAIHAVTPNAEYKRVLELGGGQSGLTKLLFPNSIVVNLDMNLSLGRDPKNRQAGVEFVCGDAASLPFAEQSFDAITMFDVLEHVRDDRRAVAEALRVLSPGGAVVMSAPNTNWRFPFYNLLRRVCPDETSILAEWGHVRRGYSLTELQNLFGFSCESNFDFINRATVLSHDLAFSALPGPVRRLGCMLLWPLTWAGYALHRKNTSGTETASCWRNENPVTRKAHGG
jgi:GT2 family glycosyltransferase/ubiquinone/menaquinone biosynthesis C-methylase UbiE